MSSDKAAKAIATRLGRHAYRAPKLSQNGRPIVTGIQVFDQVIHFPVRLGQLVEIIGVSSAGKTQVLHSIAAEVLARSENAQAKLCWFDLNGGLDTDRLCHLIHRKQGLPGEPQRSERERLLSGLMLYHPQSTPALTLTLQSLPNYWASKEGAGVDTLIIDALGIFHYLDKFEADRNISSEHQTTSYGSNHLLLSKVICELLSYQKVTIFVSKCALFDEERLQVPWPFPQAGIPMIPRDFMPGLWKSTVSHALLMYHIRADGIRRTTSTCRGVVSLAYKEGSNSFRPPSVCAATTLLIDDRGISVEGPLHKV